MVDEEQKTATLIGAVIIILLLVLGGYYIWTKVKKDSVKIPSSQAENVAPIN